MWECINNYCVSHFFHREGMKTSTLLSNNKCPRCGDEVRRKSMNWHERATAEGFRIKHLRNGSKLIGTIVSDSEPNQDGLIHVGISVLSDKDNPCMEVGRRIAYSRYTFSKGRKDDDGNKLQSHRDNSLKFFGSNPLGVKIDQACEIPKFGQVHESVIQAIISFVGE